SGESYCIQSVVRNAANAKEVAVAFNPFSALAFNGTSDALSLKVLARVGSDGGGALCGGHGSASGLRLYFDATNRAASFSVTISPAVAPWSTEAPMSTGRGAAVAGVINGVIYVVGGGDQHGVSASNEAYDPATNTWSVRAPGSPRSFAGGAVLDGK